ncbi:MAG: hypothetical protein NTZ22_00355 [Hyphomicrobiales bacterium]|nr:hypothetical protein [Hyphomicrobiales bacterium]
MNEAGGIRACFHHENRIDLEIGDLAEIGAEIGGVQRVPELLHDRAAAFCKHLRETTALLVTEGVILRDGGNALVALLQGPIGQRTREGRAGIACGADDVGDPAALGQFIGSDDGDKIGCAGALHIIGNGKAGIGQEIAGQEMHVVLFDQTAGFLQGRIGVGRIVFDDQFHLAAGDLVIDFFKPELRAFDHFLAARRNHAGQRGHQADTDRLALCHCTHRLQSGACGSKAEGG